MLTTTGSTKKNPPGHHSMINPPSYLFNTPLILWQIVIVVCSLKTSCSWIRGVQSYVASQNIIHSWRPTSLRAKKNKAPLFRCASEFPERWDDVAWLPVQFSTTMYFCAKLEVTHNPKLHEFNDSTFTQKYLIRLCTQIGGGGIYCKFPNGSERFFKFNEFVKNTATIQFWALWSKDIWRITILK